jgi:hypothetical protein
MIKIIKESILSQMTLVEIETLVNSIPKKSLGSLCYYDLYQPDTCCKGLYFIESPDKRRLYIGKASSRCVGERISAHLDSRANSMLNSLPKKVFSHNNPYSNITNKDLHNILIELQDWKVSVLFVERDEDSTVKTLIGKVESLLIADCQFHGGHCINHSIRKKKIEREVKIADLLW